MGRYVEEADVREADDLNGTAASSELIAAAIASAEDAIDAYTGVTWVPTSSNHSFVGDGSDWVVLPVLFVSEVSAVLCGSVPLSPFIASVEPGSVLRNSEGWKSGTVYTVTVEAGLESPPADIRQAAKLEAIRRVRVELLKGRQRVAGVQVSNEHGQFTFSNWSGRYGISDDGEVLRILNSRRHSTSARFSR